MRKKETQDSKMGGPPVRLVEKQVITQQISTLTCISTSLKSPLDVSSNTPKGNYNLQTPIKPKQCLNLSI
jgi:hypothetical protein